MGYQVEYLLKLAPIAAREWLSRFTGCWKEPESENERPDGEFQLWEDQCLLVSLGKTACGLRLPRVLYSWLIPPQHPPAVAHIDRFERLVLESLPGIPWVRLDELLREEWEGAVGCLWEEMQDPFGSLLSWLAASRHEQQYFRIVPPATSNA